MENFDSLLKIFNILKSSIQNIQNLAFCKYIYILSIYVCSLAGSGLCPCLGIYIDWCIMLFIVTRTLFRSFFHNKVWFPYGRKHVVTVVEIDSFSISTTFTTLLRHIHDHMETRLNRGRFCNRE